MTDEELLQNNPFVCIPAVINKSNPGQEDENGNYIFEVEASNENLDLQNQKILQSALLKSKEYFLTNGVVSDDHQHKTRKEDGTVETHKEKIIGEPISIRTEGKKTFVKGLLYGSVKAAKPFIDLLKAGSKLVKASVGGIMPTVRNNPDGTETVTGFMWNDLALTTSPVNWTVGSAKFAKSMSELDFCKALMAGSGTDSATFESGRTLQNEDLEKETVKIQELTDDGDLVGESEEDEIEKSQNSLVRECLISIDTGELQTQKDIEMFLVNRGMERNKARETTLDIIKHGGNKMSKSHFSSTIDSILKSMGAKPTDEEDEAKKTADDSEELFDDEEMENETDDSEEPEDDDIEKCGVKKSFDEEEEYIDATDLMKSLGNEVDVLKAENEALKAELKEVQDDMIKVTKSFGDYLKTPNGRATVVSKSMGGNANAENTYGKKPSVKDFDVFKSAIVNAAKKGELSPEQVQFYNHEFQKSMSGIKIKPETWNKICTIVQNNR